MQPILTTETSKKIGEQVKLAGWVETRRDHGKLVFLDLRDWAGIIQIVCKNAKEIENLRPEWVVEIEGEIKERPQEMKNPGIHTGNIEVAAARLPGFCRAKPNLSRQVLRSAPEPPTVQTALDGLGL